MKVFKFISIMFVASLFAASTALASGTQPSGTYQITPTGNNPPQNISFIATSNPAYYSYQAWAFCVNSSNHKLVYGSWHSGTGTKSQTPNCNSLLTNGRIQSAGFQYDKTNPVVIICYSYKDPDSGPC